MRRGNLDTRLSRIEGRVFDRRAAAGTEMAALREVNRLVMSNPDLHREAIRLGERVVFEGQGVLQMPEAQAYFERVRKYREERAAADARDG